MRKTALFGMAAGIGLVDAAALVWRLQPDERSRIGSLFGIGGLLALAGGMLYAHADNPRLDIRPLALVPRIDANVFARRNGYLVLLLGVAALFMLVRPKSTEHERQEGLQSARALAWAFSSHLVVGVFLPAILDAIKACCARPEQRPVVPMPVAVVPGIVAHPIPGRSASDYPLAAVVPPVLSVAVPSAPPASPNPNELPQASAPPGPAVLGDVVVDVLNPEEDPPRYASRP